MEFLLSGILAVTWRQAVMYVIGGVLVAKLLNEFYKNKINPKIGAAGI